MFEGYLGDAVSQCAAQGQAERDTIGGRVDQPLRREIKLEPDADAACYAKGHTIEPVIASDLLIRQGHCGAIDSAP